MIGLVFVAAAKNGSFQAFAFIDPKSTRLYDWCYHLHLFCLVLLSHEFDAVDVFDSYLFSQLLAGHPYLYIVTFIRHAVFPSLSHMRQLFT